MTSHQSKRRRAQRAGRGAKPAPPTAPEAAPRPWPARLRWPLGLLVGLCLGGTAWWVGGLGDEGYRYEDKKQTAMPAPGEILREVLARKDERVVVSRELTSLVAPADLARARRILEAAEVPAWIFLIPQDDPMDGSYTQHGAAEVLGANVTHGKPGYVVTLYPDGQNVVSEQGGVEGALVESTGRPGPALVRMAEEIATWSAEPEQD